MRGTSVPRLAPAKLRGISGYLRREVPKIQRGVHYHRLESDLSQTRTKKILAVLQEPEILAGLASRPVKEILIRRLTEKDVSAVYDYRAESITVNSVRKRGVHLGESFQPGMTGNMSAATNDPIESARRALLQELAHHLEGIGDGGNIMQAGFASPDKRPITQYAQTNWKEYFAESFVAHFAEPAALRQYDPNR